MKSKPQSETILRPRDLTILRVLYEYRFLDSELIWYVITRDTPRANVSYVTGRDGKARPTKYGFEKQALCKRLKQLYDAGYVQRHYTTDQPMGRGNGLPRAIYGLGIQAPMTLSRFESIPANWTRKMIQSNRVKSPYLRHTLEVAKFRIVLELACQRSSGEVRLLFWEQGISIRDSVIGLNFRGEKERFPIYPDALFALKLSPGKTKHFFLEIDRGTEPIVSFSNRSNLRRKLMGYECYRRSQMISNRFSYGIRGFQVLIVTPGQLESTGSASGRIANILDELSAHRRIYKSRSLFLLTTPESLDLRKPEAILAEVWISLKSNNSLLSLIE